MYSFMFDGKKVELPKYSVDIAMKIEALDNVEGTISDQLKAMFEFIYEIIGEQTTELLGDFENADPNMINILFLQIVNEFNKPFTDYQVKQATKVMDNPEIKKSLDAIDKLVRANQDD